MAIKVSIFSNNYDESRDLYADYSPLIEALPHIDYAPKQEDDKDLHYQGTVLVEDATFFLGLLNELGVSCVLVPVSDEMLMLRLLDDRK